MILLLVFYYNTSTYSHRERQNTNVCLYAILKTNNFNKINKKIPILYCIALFFSQVQCSDLLTSIKVDLLLFLRKNKIFFPTLPYSESS